MELETVEVEVGKMKIRAIFRTERGRMIIGGRVIDGEVRRGARTRVMRGEETVGQGKILQIKIQDKDVEKVKKGEECCVLFEGGVRVEENDILELFAQERRIPAVQSKQEEKT